MRKQNQMLPVEVGSVLGLLMGEGMSYLESLQCSSGLCFLQNTSAVLATGNIDQAEGKTIFSV